MSDTQRTMSDDLASAVERVRAMAKRRRDDAAQHLADMPHRLRYTSISEDTLTSYVDRLIEEADALDALLSALKDAGEALEFVIGLIPPHIYAMWNNPGSDLERASAVLKQLQDVIANHHVPMVMK